jgi:CRISPR system Cascade subunit CasD
MDDLAALRMGIRVDREGKLEKDFQTAQDVAVAGGNTTQNLLSNRYYLADAAFLVGFEGPAELLKLLHSALARPVWPLFLGRKSYVPSEPFFLADGLQDNISLHDALTCFRFLFTPEELKHRLEAVKKGRADKIRFVVETDAVTHEVRNDQPKSFALGKREFRQRYVATGYKDIAEFPFAREVVSCT